MRNAILNLREQRTDGEHRRVLRAAVRQLERADLYLAAVLAMDVDDVEAIQALVRLRSDLEGLRRHLADTRARIAV